MARILSNQIALYQFLFPNPAQYLPLFIHRLPAWSSPKSNPIGITGIDLSKGLLTGLFVIGIICIELSSTLSFSSLLYFETSSRMSLSTKLSIEALAWIYALSIACLFLMAVEFEGNSNHKIIEQMQKIGCEFNWQNEGTNTNMIFIKGYDLENPKQQTYMSVLRPKLIAYGKDFTSETI